MSRSRQGSRGLLCGTIVALSVWPTYGLGQEVEVRLGRAQPVGEMADIVDAGVSTLLGLEFPLVQPIGVTLRAGAEFFSSDVQAWHYVAGLRVRVIGGPDTSWRLAANVGAGGTTFGGGNSVRVPELPPPRESQLSTSWTLMGGLEVGRTLSRGLETYAFADWFFMFTHGETVAGTIGVSEGFEELSSVPFGIGVRWTRQP